MRKYIVLLLLSIVGIGASVFLVRDRGPRGPEGEKSRFPDGEPLYPGRKAHSPKRSLRRSRPAR